MGARLIGVIATAGGANGQEKGKRSANLPSASGHQGFTAPGQGSLDGVRSGKLFSRLVEAVVSPDKLHCPALGIGALRDALIHWEQWEDF